MEMAYIAPRDVREVVDGLGRTEDVRFSPSGRRLAVAAFARNRISVFDTEITRTPSGPTVTLTRALEIVSPALNRPHGLDFLNEDRVIVANRDGQAPVFHLPAARETPCTHELKPLFAVPANAVTGLHTPGSVAVSRTGQDEHELLFCNNYTHTVTRHTLWRDGSVHNSAVLLQKRLSVPDGLAVDRDHRWLAISNHNRRAVALYALDPAPGPDRDPDGLLSGLDYPHGVRFTADGRDLIVADAGAPFVHIFTRNGDDWRGLRRPALSWRVMTDPEFQRGHHNPQEGGPKGLDLDPGLNVLVVTSVHQPLAFFDLPALLARAAAHTGPDLGREFRIELERWEEVETLERGVAAQALNAQAATARAVRAEARLNVMRNSFSWRLTRILRRVYAALHRTAK